MKSTLQVVPAASDSTALAEKLRSGRWVRADRLPPMLSWPPGLEALLEWRIRRGVAYARFNWSRLAERVRGAA